MVRAARLAPMGRVTGASLVLVLAGCAVQATTPAQPAAMLASTTGPDGAAPPPSSPPSPPPGAAIPPASPGEASAPSSAGAQLDVDRGSSPAALSPGDAASSPAGAPEPVAPPPTARRAVVAKPAAPPARSPAAPPAPIVPTAIERGLALTQTRGCLACHSSDGSERVGPSWRGRWGTEITTEDGRTLRVDAVYVRRSLVDPSADRVAGFDAQMPSYAGILTDEEIEDLIAYIASLR